MFVWFFEILCLCILLLLLVVYLFSSFGAQRAGVWVCVLISYFFKSYQNNNKRWCVWFFLCFCRLASSSRPLWIFLHFKFAICDPCRLPLLPHKGQRAGEGVCGQARHGSRWAAAWSDFVQFVDQRVCAGCFFLVVEVVVVVGGGRGVFCCLLCVAFCCPWVRGGRGSCILCFSSLGIFGDG